MILMNGKEVNNLIMAGQQFSAVKSSLIGANVQTKKGQKVYYVGDVEVQISFSSEGNKVIYASTPCYMRLSDVVIQSESGG